MLFERQRRLLALVNALGDEIGSLDFQKLLFLYCREEEESPSYEFVPYKFGGFSFTSYADKRRLIERGFLAEEERIWRLTAAGKTAAVVLPSVRLRMGQFAQRHSRLRGDALVADVYRRYPYYAIRSEVAERLLSTDPSALQAIAAARPIVHGPGLCTIGYEGRTLEGYLNRLLYDGVTLLCDVRRNPLSRKYGFSKGTLSTSCEGVGIRYAHVPELGIAADKRRGLKTRRDYRELFVAYERESLPRHKDALAEIWRWIQAGDRVALTCYERMPEQCHRHCVAEALEQQFGRACAARHL